MKIKQILLTTLSAGALLAAGTVAANADSNVTVKSGDTVSALAYANNTSIDAIINANQLQNQGDLIYVGQNLIIPDGTSNTTTTTTTQAAAPVQQAAPVAQTQPVAKTQAPVAQTTTQAAPAQQTAPVQQAQTTQASTTQNTQAASTSTASSSDEAAMAYIAAGESGGSYSARNGQYIGKYQLSADKLNGDYSAANQERVASAYAVSRYGSWSAAASHWAAYRGW
ncbi:LysM peptidoglycan-binding domain-containing protein [Furfurilactobacillus milii]|uniref:LysM peptidoglycan-binding domain-containing protein n=1 Tax=Furfurilactobacillus milii TaxID=2888272 RepID=A0ABT6DAL8_9LACO|nr:LysM peptidoglycan-binding domain-containing protein [Furfurilactobacillus milii]QLE67040.1 Aggregation promoting factor [Furfurilactobacillus rossiae]MCF6161299.1 LysM peptidoglycan-binding domain-containing protein [Furfurilactobacillus milii]MCF6163679.1 LysM peptidoglycan-binding domain-containing protein [Furfurilactobacillus milii]MCF6418950.1 LysM peptidoglycan-binding domain-containing protein [Furfurilactobacillus milii]MDF9914175.1 LysM peptidoglycan-binding domain-containing prot